MKQIPNIFTLLNLVFGCVSVIYSLQVGQSIVIQNEQTGAFDPFFPEKLAWGALFIFLAAIVDFFDGFVARLLNASSEMGKQLDSLSDVVSFGVAPGMILYQLLRLGYAQEVDGLNVSILALLPAFLFTAAVAWRLAKFNISTDQTNSFRGVPSPAAGLVVASFPLIIWYEYFGIQQLLINVWILYAVIILLGYLLVSNLRMMALKFNDFSLASNKTRYLLILLSVIAVVFLKWASVPVIFLLYVVLSLSNRDEPSLTSRQKETLDMTV